MSRPEVGARPLCVVSISQSMRMRSSASQVSLETGRALANVLSGLRNDFSGSIDLNGIPLKTGDPRAIVASGVGRIPEDRHASRYRGRYGDLGESCIRRPASAEFSRKGVFIDKARHLPAQRCRSNEFDIRCEGPHAETRAAFRWEHAKANPGPGAVARAVLHSGQPAGARA